MRPVPPAPVIPPVLTQTRYERFREAAILAEETDATLVELAQLGHAAEALQRSSETGGVSGELRTH